MGEKEGIKGVPIRILVPLLDALYLWVHSARTRASSNTLLIPEPADTWIRMGTLVRPF